MMNGRDHPAPVPRSGRGTIATTMPASQAQAGRGAALSAKLDLGQPPRELRRLRRAGLDPDLGRGARDLAEHGVRDRVAARRLLERRRVQLGDALEVVLAPGELARRRRPSPRARPRRAASSSSAACSVSTSRSSTGTFSATSSGSSENQPTSLTTSGLPSESSRIDAAGRLAHRRRAQVDVARRTRPSAPRAAPPSRSPRG